MSAIHRFWRLFALCVGIFFLPVTAEGATERYNCVLYVQNASSINLRGDAWQWWDAAGRQHARGDVPYPGAVFVFSRSSRLPQGHVAVVRTIIDARTVLIDHANWGGRRGQVERAVPMIDVSPANDWSQVRVWYAPTESLGQRTYAGYGFIYPEL